MRLSEAEIFGVQHVQFFKLAWHTTLNMIFEDFVWRGKKANRLYVVRLRSFLPGFGFHDGGNQEQLSQFIPDVEEVPVLETYFGLGAFRSVSSTSQSETFSPSCSVMIGTERIWSVSYRTR